MLHLQVLRHAKSDWDASATDHARPLNDRGERSADAMGVLLADIGRMPQHAITSTATRARTTLLRAIAAGEWDTRAEETDALYETTVQGALAVISEATGVERLMVVGHQPIWGALVQHLTSGSVEMSTATVVGINLPISSWSEIAKAQGSITHVLRARDFLED